MNFINRITSGLMSEECQQFALKTGGCTVLAAICGYGGTFFFTNLNPRVGAFYLATVALISVVAYQAFEKVKSPIKSPMLKQMVEVLQFAQFPLCFYFLHAPGYRLSAAVKLEIISATAYFIAIPFFFRFAVVAWNEPTFANVGTAVGVMLQIADQLGNYAKGFK